MAEQPLATPAAGDAPLTGHAEKHLLLEQYKIFVEMADRLNARRLLVNNSYITMMGAGAFAYSAAPQYFKGGFATFFQLGMTLACALLALMWRVTIRYYRDLAAAKFRVIDEMETLLPAQPYTLEWKYMTAQKSAEGKETLVTQSWIEMRVPTFAGVVALCGFFYTLTEVIRSLI